MIVGARLQSRHRAATRWFRSPRGTLRVLLHTPVQRQADLPWPRENFGIFDRGFVLQVIGIDPNCACPEDLDGSGEIDAGDIALLLLLMFSKSVYTASLNTFYVFFLMEKFHVTLLGA